MEVTREQFDAYRRVQFGGLYNMFDPRAIAATGLDRKVYVSVMDQYHSLEKLYGPYKEYRISPQSRS